MKVKKEYGLIMLLNLIILLPLFLIPNKMGHDMNFHLANIDVLASNLSWETLFNGFAIRNDIANNLGYGIGIFYPILPHLIGAINYNVLSIIGIDIVTSVYFLYLLISIISSLLIYNLAYKLYNNKKIAFVSSLIYLIMPYFIGNMFIRFALNEIFFFMFFLILLNGLFYFKDNNIHKYYFFFIIGYIGMIYSHLVLSLYASIFFIVFILINIKEVKKKIKHLLIAILIVTVFVLPNIILLLPHQLSNLYVFNQPGIMTSKELVTTEALDLFRLISPKSDYNWDVPVYIPIIITTLLIISLIYLFKNYQKINDKNIIYIFTTFVIAFLMVTKIFPWSLLPDILLMIQFPWRLMGVVIISISLLAPALLYYFKDKKYFNKLIIIFVLVLLASNIPFINKLSARIYNYQGYTINEAMGHQNEYLPYPLVDNWIKRGNDIIIDDGEALILDNTDKFIFEIRNSKNSTKVELPKLYYEGYILKCDKHHYHSVINKNGYVSTLIEHDGKYRLIYVGTIPYIITRIGRLIFIIWLITYLIRKKALYL